MRYIARSPQSRPKAMEQDPWEEEAPHTAVTVHEAETDTWSGLYDSGGNELHRKRAPMGFAQAVTGKSLKTGKTPKGKR